MVRSIIDKAFIVSGVVFEIAEVFCGTNEEVEGGETV